MLEKDSRGLKGGLGTSGVIIGTGNHPPGEMKHPGQAKTEQTPLGRKYRSREMSYRRVTEMRARRGLGCSPYKEAESDGQKAGRGGTRWGKKGNINP